MTQRVYTLVFYNAISWRRFRYTSDEPVYLYFEYFEYFDFYITGMCLYNCFYSGWVNSYDGYFDYTVPPGHVMRGWTSTHDNGAEYVVKLLHVKKFYFWKIIRKILWRHDLFYLFKDVLHIIMYNLLQR